jgi:hypothetical protein
MDDHVPAGKCLYVVHDLGVGCPSLVCFADGVRVHAEEMGPERMMLLAEDLIAASRRLIARMPRPADYPGSPSQGRATGDGVSGD